jgi:hypothetical protein
MKTKWYRLVYKDHSHGAWANDIERLRENANFFGAEIEEMEFDDEHNTRVYKMHTNDR